MPTFTYLGLSEDHQKTMIKNRVDAARPVTKIRDTRNIVAYEAAKAVQEKEMDFRRQEINEEVSAMDAVYTYGSYVFKKGAAVEVDADDKELVARLERRVKHGTFSKGAAPKPVPPKTKSKKLED